MVMCYTGQLFTFISSDGNDIHWWWCAIRLSNVHVYPFIPPANMCCWSLVSRAYCLWFGSSYIPPCSSLRKF